MTRPRLELGLVLLYLSVLLSATIPPAVCNPVEISIRFDSDPEQTQQDGVKMLKSMVVDLHKTIRGYLNRMKKEDSSRKGRDVDADGEGTETLEKEDDAVISEVAKDFTHSLSIVQTLITKHQRSKKRLRLLRKSEKTQKMLAKMG